MIFRLRLMMTYDDVFADFFGLLNFTTWWDTDLPKAENNLVFLATNN